MELYAEEYGALIEALEQGPNPSSAQEVTGARIDLFSRAKGIDSFPTGTNPMALNRQMGYIGALTLITAMTPDLQMDQSSKLGILSAGAAHLDRELGRNGRCTILTIVRNVDRAIFRAEVSCSPVSTLRSDVFETYIQARRHIVGKPLGQLASERLDRLVNQIIPEVGARNYTLEMLNTLSHEMTLVQEYSPNNGTDLL